MIESIYTSISILGEIRQTPFNSFVEEFAREHFDKGYGIPAIRHKLSIIIKFIRWAGYNSVTPSKLAKHHIVKFRGAMPELKKNHIGSGNWKGFVDFLSIIENKYCNCLIDKPLQRFYKMPGILLEIEKFKKFMSDERGLTPTSIIRFETTIKQFLVFVFPKDRFDSKKIKASDILEFIQERGKHFNDRTLRCDGSAIKCYMRFLYGKGLTKTDLSYAVPAFSVWRNQNVIHTISEEEMLKMLGSCNLDEPTGVRDFAILLLLMRYGLRPIEIIHLKLGDICWSERKIIIHGKGRKTSHLPLESDVECALTRYIKSARPASHDKEVFIRSMAPFVRFTQSGAVSSVVRHALDRCGLKPEISGARLLRYSVASAILNKGGTLMEVSELLRHSSINTSVRYTRLDMNRLKLVPLAWPTEWKKAA